MISFLSISIWRRGSIFQSVIFILQNLNLADKSIVVISHAIKKLSFVYLAILIKISPSEKKAINK